MLSQESFKREKLPSQVAARLRKDIYTGHFQPGDRLPPEREIGERFGISRITVRQALQELAREEWIEIVQGRGAVVLDYGSRIGLDVLPALLASCPQEAVTPEAFGIMHDFSVWLSKQICLSAAQRAQRSQKKKLLKIIHECKDGISAERHIDIDRRFNGELLAIGGNLILKMFFNTYLKTFRYLVESGALPCAPVSADLYVRCNADLVEAICENQCKRIEQIIDGYRDEFKADLAGHLTALGIKID